MSEQNLYKISFSSGFGVVANIIACAPKETKELEVLDMITKEVVSNYCDDNHYIYNQEIINDFKDGSNFRLLGTFKPLSEDYVDDKLTIISLNKTRRWGN